MTALLTVLAILTFFTSVLAAPTPQSAQVTLTLDVDAESEKYNLDPVGTYAFAGIDTFRKLPSVDCLSEPGPADDILIVGLPFDTATSYRTGTRFGPNGIRRGSAAGALTYDSSLLSPVSNGATPKYLTDLSSKVVIIIIVKASTPSPAAPP
jgi:hypothetical protein